MATNVETAFIKTAAKIYENILSGVYDPTNEVSLSSDLRGVFVPFVVLVVDDPSVVHSSRIFVISAA